ncbi:MAG TPA: SPFH domain-containing protein [Gaiellales bacterium]|jgi:regulator of protease activity HflC (stomatin/prohibitin superfamily)
MAALIVAIVLALFAVLVVASSVRIVRQARVGIVERWGKYRATLAPGLHLIVPMLDRISSIVDMRETVQAFAPQPVITQDNVTIGIDTVVYYQVTDPFRATYEVANVLVAMEQLAITTLRNVVGAMTLEETLTSRDQINSQLRFVLDEATEKWGVRVTRVELKSIDPPRTIQEAMEQQMRADRAKRAAILMAEGEKQSAILRAEGLRQAQILNAEAEQQANVLRAEGEKKARALRAEGEAEALSKVFTMVRESGTSPSDMLGYKYLDALPAVAAGDANKLLLLPSGASNAMSAIAGLGAAFTEGAAEPTPRPKPKPRREGDGNPPPPPQTDGT